MKQLVIGVLAHVDAGKTTLSEALLYTAGAIPTRGTGAGSSAFRSGVRQLSRCMYWGTWSYFTVKPPPWAQNTESGVCSRSRSGS